MVKYLTFFVFLKILLLESGSDTEIVELITPQETARSSIDNRLLFFFFVFFKKSISFVSSGSFRRRSTTNNLESK